MPDDYVKRAEEVIKKLKAKGGKMITTNQLRKFLSMLNAISNQIAGEEARENFKKELSPAVQDQIKYLKVMLAYQIGRNENRHGNPVREFVEEAGLLTEIDKIGASREKYKEFARYVEALVAYHKYYGGE